MQSINRHLLLLLPLVALLGLAGCENAGYYWQCIRGQVDLLERARPVQEVIDDPETEENVRDKLHLATEIRDFASRELALPDNLSYRRFADLERDYAVWNVVATAEFSLEPLSWCFPVAGCVSYRGFFDATSARDFAGELQVSGHDVFRYGVTAYSTLNWFDDPLLNTFWQRSETGVASLIFHELSHQVVYLKGNSAFNESFASAVEIAGTMQWLQSHGDQAGLKRYRWQMEVEKRFSQLATETRDQLEQLYSGALPTVRKRAEKQQIIHRFQQQLGELATTEGHSQLFSSWRKEGLNNARFALLGTYQDLVPAFLNLLALKNYRYTDFFAEVKRLSRLPDNERVQALNHLQTLPHYARLLDHFSA